MAGEDCETREGPVEARRRTPRRALPNELAAPDQSLELGELGGAAASGPPRQSHQESIEGIAEKPARQESLKSHEFTDDQGASHPLLDLEPLGHRDGLATDLEANPPFDVERAGC
jgi:hypothetical protein